MGGMTSGLLLVLPTLFHATHADPPAASPVPQVGKSPDIVGIWLGTLSTGVLDLRLGFEFIGTEKGGLIGKMTSIDQGGVALPCTVQWKDERLTLSVALGLAKYSGKRNGDGEIEGEFEQNGQKFSLVLKRVGKLPKLNRPQLPSKPYPYPSRDVAFKNEKAQITLSGTLTLPEGDGPFPAVVLVSGSGPQDRDETIFGHKPFLVIADHLARKGIACLRYDDRGTGKSTGKHSLATTEDFAGDAHAALSFLRAQERVDPARVGICGHSEGGIIGPLVAEKSPGEVAFLILLAGPGISGEKVVRGQMGDFGRMQPGAEKQVETQLELCKTLIPIAISAQSTTDAVSRMKTAAETFEKDKGNTKPPAEAIKPWLPLINQLSVPWMRWFLGHDPLQALGRVNCPVLALNGEKDLQVKPRENLSAINQAFPGNRAHLLTQREFPGLNHMFQHCTTGGVNEYGQIEETISPEVLDLMVSWILEPKNLAAEGMAPGKPGRFKKLRNLFSIGRQKPISR